MGTDPSPEMLDLRALKQRLRQFVAERDWEQFHSPRNLATALAVEASELLEHFQWQAGGEELPAEKRAAIQQEVADVLIYLVRFADVMQIDLPSAVEEKLVLNAGKYPVEKCKGTATKYDTL